MNRKLIISMALAIMFLTSFIMGKVEANKLISKQLTNALRPTVTKLLPGMETEAFLNLGAGEIIGQMTGLSIVAIDPDNLLSGSSGMIVSSELNEIIGMLDLGLKVNFTNISIVDARRINSNKILDFTKSNSSIFEDYPGGKKMGYLALLSMASKMQVLLIRKILADDSTLPIEMVDQLRISLLQILDITEVRGNMRDFKILSYSKLKELEVIIKEICDAYQKAKIALDKHENPVEIDLLIYDAVNKIVDDLGYLAANLIKKMHLDSYQKLNAASSKAKVTAVINCMLELMENLGIFTKVEVNEMWPSTFAVRYNTFMDRFRNAPIDIDIDAAMKKATRGPFNPENEINPAGMVMPRTF